MSTWETLGIAATQDEGAIRKAYAARVRQWRPDTHPREFAQLREAYEAALRAMRAAAPEPAREVEVSVAPATVAATAPATAPAPEPVPPRYAAAEALMAQLAQCFREQGETAAVVMLREHHAALTAQTIDARSDWETVLLHSLLTAAMPPVALLFEGDRLLRWREREQDVRQMFGEQAAQRLRSLLDLSAEAMYARYFSRNRWHTRLFGNAPVRWFGLGPWVLRARGTAAWWKEATQAANVDPAMQQLHPEALHRVGGRMLLSTDALLALFLAWIAANALNDAHAFTSGWLTAGAAALAFLLALPLPWAARLSRGTRPVQALVRLRAKAETTVWFMAGAFAIIGGMILAVIEDVPTPVHVAGWLLIALPVLALAIGILWFAWMCVCVVELLLARPVLWLQQAWGLHAFQQVREGRDVPTWREQVRRLPSAAVQAWKTGRAQRKVQAGAKKKRGFRWWWLFVAIWLVQMLVRLGAALH